MSTTIRDSLESSGIREHNLSQVLKLIHEGQSISRASIVRDTGLSATAVSSIVTNLLESGYVSETGEGQSSGGRPPILVEFNPDYRFVAGVDLGASHITSVISNLAGKIQAKETQRYGTAEDPQGAMQVIQAQLSALFKQPKFNMSDCLGIGVSVPAPLEGEKLDRFSPVWFHKWKDILITERIQQEFTLPIYIDNDANAGAIAEKWWGSGQGVSNLVYIKLGTGVGSGLIINDEIYRGAGGTAGEIGHTTIDINGPLCRCGNCGCMESFVGIPAILRDTLEKIPSHPNTRLVSQELSIEAITQAARDGDPLALEIVHTAGHNLGIAIANSLNLINPELVVLGGELVEAGDIFMDSVRESAFNRSISKAVSEVTIKTSSLDWDAIPLGAATLVIHYSFLPTKIRQTLYQRKEVRTG